MGDGHRFTNDDLITYKQIPPSIPSGEKLIVLNRLSGPRVANPRYRIGYKTEEVVGSRRSVTPVPVINEINSSDICSKGGEKKTEYAVDEEVKIDYESHDGVIIQLEEFGNYLIRLNKGSLKRASESELSEQEGSDSEMASMKKRKSKKRKSKKRKSKKRKSKKRKSKKRKSKRKQFQNSY
jgi:hypothetical protein